MKRKRYPSALTDAQWAILSPLLPAAKPGGRPHTVALQEGVNGRLYVLGSGCACLCGARRQAWRARSIDLPPWQTVYQYFRRWKHDGTWERVYEGLRPRGR